MFEALMTRLTWNRALVPTLAAAAPERLDATTWRVKLREGRTFSDGSPITANDVKFSFDRILAPATKSPWADYLGFISRVSVVDPHTLMFKTSIATDLLPGRLPLGKVISPAALKARGPKQFSLDPGVGSGSMINTQPLQQNTVSLKRFDNYNGVLPVNADTATWTYVSDIATRIAQLEGGQLHLIQDLGAKNLAALKASSQVTYQASPLEQSTYIETFMFNCGKKPFSDVRVRQAVMYAIDREQLVQIGSLGQAVIADSPLPKSMPEHVTPSVVYDHDPDKARSLLKAAGYENGFTFELNVSDQAPVQPHAPLLYSQLKAVGLNPQLKIAGIDSQFSRVFAGQYDAYVFPTQFEIFGYDADTLIRGWWGGYFNQHAAFWTTPGAKSIPKLLDAALVAKSPGSRRSLYGRVQQIIVEEAASAPMIFHPQIQAWRKELVDYKGSFTFVAPIFNAHPA